MKMDLIYGFNNQPLSRFLEYELKIINNIKYVVPKKDKGYTLTCFDEFEDNDKPLIDFINLGKLSLEQENTDKELIEYVNRYGLLGFIHDFPVNRYYTLDKEVLLKEFNYINNSDCFSRMKMVDYFKVFFPTCSNDEIKELINKSNELICQHSMEKYISPDLNDLYFKNEKYCEQADMIIKYAQFLYNILKKLYKNDNKILDYMEINKLESNHIRVNLEYDGLSIYIRSLKEYLDEDFKLFATQEKKYLKLCKHCGKAFTAKNPKAEYDTFNCKNQENVYKSRQRASLNIVKSENGLSIKITKDEEN